MKRLALGAALATFAFLRERHRAETVYAGTDPERAVCEEFFAPSSMRAMALSINR